MMLYNLYFIFHDNIKLAHSFRVLRIFCIAASIEVGIYPNKTVWLLVYMREDLGKGTYTFCFTTIFKMSVILCLLPGNYSKLHTFGYTYLT